MTTAIGGGFLSYIKRTPQFSEGMPFIFVGCRTPYKVNAIHTEFIGFSFNYLT
jgi:hypothetical protein